MPPGASSLSRPFVSSPAAAIPPVLRPEADLQQPIKRDVYRLAGEIGERNLWRYEALIAAAGYIESRFEEMGYSVHSQEYSVAGKKVRNLEVEIPGRAAAGEEIVLIGAHYDSVFGSPGANDNASGVAALLAIARVLRQMEPKRTIRLVAFVNEEPPFFMTASMGSLVYARRTHEQEVKIVAMLSLETMGYYTQARASQSFPLKALSLFYPDAGNFLAFVGNFGSGRLLHQTLKAFRRHSSFPSEGLAAPEWVIGVGWSDHWAFWEQGYRAIMVTDTALFRYPYYHTDADTPEKLDYTSLAKVTAGLAMVVAELAGGSLPDKEIVE